MFFTDTHAHLHFPDYQGETGEVLERARQAGVELLINVGTDLASSRESLALAERYDRIYAAAGVHPHDAKDAGPEVIEAIAGLLSHPRMVAIGEVGLDFFRNHSPKEKQIDVFLAFVKLHVSTGKPLIIHCRDAYDDLVDILRKEGKAPYRGVIHCFSSDARILHELTGLGFFISFAGPLTYKKNEALREACRACPLDRLLLETDAPFLPPQSMRGKRNEPAFLVETAGTAASLHGVSLEEMAERTTRNARNLFGL